MTISVIALTIAVAVAVVALVLVWLGYQLALGRMRDAHTDIARQQAALDAQWWQLDQTRRIRSVFWAARRAMQREAEDSLWPPVTDDYTNSNQEESAR
jgi:hypothetical protein